MPPKIKTARDLVTSRQATAAGFLEQAITKTHESEQFVNAAIELTQALSDVATVGDALKLKSIREQLMTAAGFSDKAQNWVTQDEIRTALAEGIGTHEGDDWREQIVCRFLLTRGDTLGGKMRNIIGAAAGRKLTAAITDALARKKTRIETKESRAGKVQSISWDRRMMVFDKKPPKVNKSIDAILMDMSTKGYNPSDRLKKRPQDFLACGELKGGIDPAGADEHWKTANSALDRIRRAFRKDKSKPQLFFVGAAIEQAMADEIFDQLKSGELAFAANLTDEQQVVDLAAWIVSL